MIERLVQNRMQLLEKYKTREFPGVKGLVDAVSEIVQQVNETPVEDKLLEAPNIRTVRFYITEGLLPSATEKLGQLLLFQYPHLIALLLIKWFQAWGIPISVIKEALGKMSVGQMEKAFGQRVVVFTDQRQIDAFVETHGKEGDEDTVVIGEPRAQNEYLSIERDADEIIANEAKGHTAPVFAGGTENEPMHHPASGEHRRSQSSLPNSEDNGLWRRTKLAPGLEINIDQKFKLTDAKEVAQLLEEVALIFNKYLR